MKYVVIVSILLSYTNFFYAAEELSSREKSSCKMRFLYLPTCCRISQEDYYRCWCDAAGKDKNNIVAGVEFLDQFDQKKNSIINSICAKNNWYNSRSLYSLFDAIYGCYF